MASNGCRKKEGGIHVHRLKSPPVFYRHGDGFLAYLDARGVDDSIYWARFKNSIDEALNILGLR